MSPCSFETDAPPDSARGHTPKQPSHWRGPAAAAATASHCGGCAVAATVLQFALGEERKGTDVWHGEHLQCINEHSWAPKPLWHLQFAWEHSGFTQAQGFYPEQDSDLREKRDACSLCTSAAPIFAGWLQVQSNTEQNTVFLIKRKIHSWHCIRWVPKAFQGQMKRLMAPSWGAAAPSSIHCQYRQPDQGRGRVVTEPLSHSHGALLSCSIALQK